MKMLNGGKKNSKDLGIIMSLILGGKMKNT
jgi:hypothetical protein